MTREQADSLYPKIKDSVDNHLKAVELLKKLVISIEWEVGKSNGEGFTTDSWDKRRAEVLYSTGLGPKPNKWMRY